MKRARIIYNPTSGREVFKRELPYVLEQFEQAGYETSAHATTHEGDGIEASEDAVRRGFDVIVAVGGDGTINEVINGMAQFEEKPRLGIIPAGTTNDFARALGIPRDVKEATEIILQNETMHLDIGKVNDRYFMNIAGGGKLTELTYEVPSKLKAILGQLAYYIKGIEMLPSLKPIHARIQLDDEVIEEDIMLFLVANTNSVGGFEKLAPDAKLNDGYFDVIILTKTNLAEFLRIATFALRGNHLDVKQIIYRQAKYVSVKTDDKMLLNIDGEYGGLLPGEFENLQEFIEFFVPKSFKEEGSNQEEKVSL